MASFAVTNTFVSDATITAAGHNTNWSDITTYINNRNAGTTTWDAISSAGDVKMAATKKFYPDGGGDTYFTESSANVLDIYAGATLSVTILPTDFYTVAFTDYSATSTVVGWTSFTLKEIRYKKIGKLVWVWYTITGTSNAVTTTFTLPYPSSNTIETYTHHYAVDNGGTAVAGLVYLNKNSATVNLYSTPAAGAWTNSGTKQTQGILFYQTT